MASPDRAAAPNLPSSSDDDDKHFTISQIVFDNLIQRGFSENAIKNSVVAGCINESTCAQWITMHEGHPDLDKPLADGVEVTIKTKRTLTESERAEKVKELHLKIKAKKEADAEEARKKELARIDMGRKAALVKHEVDEVRRKMEMEEAARERAEDAAAKKRIKVQLLADKYERQGMSDDQALLRATKEVEEATERAAQEATEKMRQLQQEQERRRLAALGQTSPQAAASTSGGHQWNLTALLDATPDVVDSIQRAFDSPVDEAGNSIEDAATRIHACEDTEKHAVCVETLKLILNNICEHPFDTKKRTLKTTTKTFTQRILPVDGSLMFLKSCNFDLATDSEGGQILMMSTVVLRSLRRAVELLS